MRYGAFGLVEVLGSSNAIAAADKMLKTAEVSFLTWDYKCGGHVLLIMTGSVAAVTAAVEAVREEPPCKIFFAGVISNPSEETVRIAEERAKRFHFA
ncbi:MAG TPA: BMC domain-containing protein [Candidatus Limivivens merdigallinarum]|mgnify:CR=1 FL=1|uniref:BMC domain-containing protein n=1 Tax=Candidatus Limivivens merdigallinarum TaxID=2840859 RepID=A0A9D0ZSP4_9FIRM|nr:BMC domain-containing protein [Candidatus Limivivens merdigallinarum]